MKDINIWHPLAEGERSVVTLGKFDGLHRGHQKLIRQVQEGKKEGLSAIAFIFDVSDKMLLTKSERRMLLEEYGIDYLAECPLDQKIMHMSPEEFVQKILVENLRIARVVVGEDFRFGYQRKGSPELLKSMGEHFDFEVEVISKEMAGNRKVSSTYVREQLNEGNMEKVRELLGRSFITTGEVLHGRGLGHRKLIPTTNLIPPKEKLMPPNGVYLTRSFFEDQIFQGITNVGYKPTVGGEEFLGVETFLFQCDENLYGKISRVEFLRFMRPERAFPTLDALKLQLGEDVKTAKKLFSLEQF